MPWRFTSLVDGNLATHVNDDPDAVADRRAELSLSIGLPISWMDQVHGADVAVVDRTTPADRPCDAQVTADPGIALGVLVADCIPLLLHSAECVAVAHVGRRGLEQEVAAATVTAMRDHFSAAAITAVIGPSICGSCYEVPRSMHDEIVARWPEASAVTPTGTFAVDLAAGLVAQLAALDVAVERDPRCTREEAGLPSHRRDPASGRFAGVIWR